MHLNLQTPFVSSRTKFGRSHQPTCRQYRSAPQRSQTQPSPFRTPSRSRFRIPRRGVQPMSENPCRQPSSLRCVANASSLLGDLPHHMKSTDVQHYKPLFRWRTHGRRASPSPARWIGDADGRPFVMHLLTVNAKKNSNRSAFYGTQARSGT